MGFREFMRVPDGRRALADSRFWGLRGVALWDGVLESRALFAFSKFADAIVLQAYALSSGGL